MKESKKDLACEELKKHSYKLNVDDEAETNLYEAYINGVSVTSQRAQSVFRNIVKRVSPHLKVSFSHKYGFIPVIIERYGI